MKKRTYYIVIWLITFLSAFFYAISLMFKLDPMFIVVFYIMVESLENVDYYITEFKE